jgi:H+/gluconate symporter-like permease
VSPFGCDVSVSFLGCVQDGVKATTVIERVLAVSWLVLPIGLLVSSTVCSFVLWRTPAADTAYRQAVVAHGGSRTVLSLAAVLCYAVLSKYSSKYSHSQAAAACVGSFTVSALLLCQSFPHTRLHWWLL